jgi:hypothetical protein
MQIIAYFYTMKTSVTRARIHHGIYLAALALLVCSLPLSRYMLSISQFILALNWLAEGEFAKKTGLLRRKPAVLLFASIFLIYTAGMFYSANLTMALTKVKNVLPLLLLPVIMCTSAPLTSKNRSRLLLLFTLAVALAAAICLIVYLYNPAASTRDFRKISLFIPHIRFSLLIILAVFILFYQTIFSDYPSFRFSGIFMVLVAILLIAFLFVLRSFAGLIILFLTGTLFAVQAARFSKISILRYLVIFSLVILYSLAIGSVTYVEIRDFHARPVNPASLEKLTAGGHAYQHDLHDKELENGNYVNIYVCESELRKEWNRRSQILYDSGDHKGQRVRTTLLRYLTSKGLRKDSAGLSQLGNEEIDAIEKGRANYRFEVRPGIYQRLYETLWEIHMWRNTGFVLYHSFGQRIVFLKSAAQIIRNNFFTGVGTGDVYDMMLKTTRENHDAIEMRWKGEPHNQFAFLFMAFGIFGFLWILFSWIYPVFLYRSYRQLLFNMFFILILISMTILDTIESYDNMVFFGFFYTFFVLCGEIQKKT